MRAQHTPGPGPWQTLSYLNAAGNAYWIVCRDRFAGRDYVLTRTGRRRRFLSAENARAAIIKANRRERVK